MHSATRSLLTSRATLKGPFQLRQLEILGAWLEEWSFNRRSSARPSNNGSPLIRCSAPRIGESAACSAPDCREPFRLLLDANSYLAPLLTVLQHPGWRF